MDKFSRAAILITCFLWAQLAPAQDSDSVAAADADIEIESEAEAAEAETQTQTQTQTQTIQSNSRPLEEITVVGERTMAAVRYQLRMAEDSLYRLFNELNSSDDFDVTCRSINYTGSHIRRRSCEPRFLTRERQANATFAMSQWRDANRNAFGGDTSISGISDFSALIDFRDSPGEIISMLRERFQAMGEDMIRVASENPEYLRALLQVDTLNKELNSLWDERFGN